MDSALEQLIEAEKKAAFLFQEIEKRELICPNKMESELNTEIFELAFELFGIRKYWHKRIVRAGSNTLHPYHSNPEDLRIKADDIVFLDFGPIFEEWEADFGRTFVLGNDPKKLKLKTDIETAWQDCKNFYFQQKEIRGNELYAYAFSLAQQYGWEFGSEIAGHLIGHFPHEQLEKEDKRNYIHSKNQELMSLPDRKGEKRNWILEIHFIDRENEIGGFFEQLLIN